MIHMHLSQKCFVLILRVANFVLVSVLGLLSWSCSQIALPY